MLGLAHILKHLNYKDFNLKLHIFSDASIRDGDVSQLDSLRPQPVRLSHHPLRPLHRPHGPLLHPLHAVLPQGLRLKEEIN